MYKPRRRRGSIVADKAAKEARRRIRIAKKAAKSQADAVKKTRAPRRTKEEIQIAAMVKELERQAAWQTKFATKYGLNKTKLRQVIKAAKATM